MTSTHTNILFILSDDQGAWAMGCAGNDEIETPNLDRLAETGMRFENFFCASPVCSPARATLLTGRIPSQHGIHDWLAAGNTTAAYEPERNGELTEYLVGQPGYTDYLAAAGYDCGISGKWHLGDSHHAQKGLRLLGSPCQRRRSLLQCAHGAQWRSLRGSRIRHGCLHGQRAPVAGGALAE
jgi:arylsulfatase A-like enzyme